METIAPTRSWGSEIDNEPDGFVSLTHEQAAVVKATNPATSPWWVVAGQVILGSVLVVLAWALFDLRIAKSMACGVLAVVIPSALFARGLTSQFARANVGAAVMSFFLWELVKIVVTLGLFFVAHRLVSDLNWPAMLVGFVVTIKVYWLALAFKRQAKPVRVINASWQK